MFITPDAASVLKSVRLPAGGVLRLETGENGQIELEVGAPAADDHVVTAGGIEVLRVSAGIADQLDDAFMDVAPASAAGPPSKGPAPRLKLVVNRRHRTGQEPTDPAPGAPA